MNPGSDADLTCSLGWRIRDLETRQLRFGEKCSGSIESTGDGMLRGCLVRVSGVEGGWVRQGGLSALNGGCLATMGWVGRALSPDICVRVRRLEV